MQRAEYADLKIYLPNDVLVKVDRMSMAHSLEVRCPLLDRRVVELAFRMPRPTKMPGLKAKHLLRQLGRARLPEALHRLPKHGFSAPVGEWMARSYRSAFESDVLTSSSFASQPSRYAARPNAAQRPRRVARLTTRTRCGDLDDGTVGAATRSHAVH